MVQVKGGTLMPRVRYLHTRGTGEQQAAVLAELSPECRREIELGVLVNRWYPFDYFVQLNRTLDKILGQGGGSLFFSIAHSLPLVVKPSSFSESLAGT